MEFEYIAWGSGEIVVRTLRALTIINGSGILNGALVATSLLSLLFLAVSAAFMPNVQTVTAPLRKLVALVIITGVLMAPCTVVVTDSFDLQDALQGVPLGVQGTTVINRVPFGAALPAAFASHLAETLTQAVDTAMRPVGNDDQFSRTGLWLSARALRAMLSVQGHPDTNLPGDFRRFVVNCTYFDLQNGRVRSAQLRNGNLVTELGRTAGGLTSVHRGATATGAVVPVSCPQAWNGGTTSAGVQVTGLEDRLEQQGRWRKFRACHSLQGLGLAMNTRQLDAAKAVARRPLQQRAATCGNRVFRNALSTFGFNANVVDQFKELVAIELMRDSSHTLASQDPQALALATFIGRRQRDAAYVIAGELAAQILPALRGMLEAIVLILLPVMLLLGLLFFEQFASYLKNAFMLVVWLHLWPPVMVVINNIGLWIQAAAFNEHAILADGRFSLEGVEQLLADVDSQLALSRYMLVLVPMIAWSLVRVGQFSGGMLAARLMQPGEQVGGSLGSNVATNNWQTDQVNMAPRTNVGPHVATVGDAWGGTTTVHPQMTTMSLPTNTPGHMGVTHSQTLTEGLTRRAEQARAQVSEQRQQFASSMESAYQQAYGTQGSKTLSTLRSEGVTDETSLRALQGTGEVLRQTSNRMRTISQQEGSNQTWSMGHEHSFGMNVVTLKNSGGFGARQDQSVGVNEQMQRSYNQLDDRTKEAMQQVSQALSHSEGVAATTTNAQTSSEGFTATVNEAQSQQESVTESQQQSARFSRASELAHTTGRTVMRDMLKDPRQAGLLQEMHRLYHGEGMPFEQAWSQAQESSGVRMDLDEVASKILQSELKQEPQPVANPYAVRQAAAANRQRVDANQPAAPAAPAELAAGREQLAADSAAVSQRELPAAGEEHYDESRRLDRTVVTEEGDKLVIANESLYEKGEKRATWLVNDRVGISNTDDKEEANKEQ